jgi:threonylcarbamoyladenosine tRNA methylthiotransferase MtaB
MPAVNGNDIKRRAARLRDEGARQVARYLHAQIGRNAEVLMERPRFGRTESFAEVSFDQDQAVGSIVETEITGSTETQLSGRPAL